MLKSSKARLFSTCLTGAVLAAATPAWAQTSDAPTWKPRAEAEAQAGKDIGVSTSLFAPIAQNDSSLVYVDGRIGYDQRFDRNGSATVGARFRTGEDTAIGVNVGADFYRSDIGSRDQAALSMGLEGFSSVFDVRVNYRLPLSKTRTIGFIDPNATGPGTLVLESNRLIERHSGFRLEAIPLQGFNGEAGVRLPVGDNASIRGSVGGFDYWDRKADESYRGVRGGLELDIEDKDSGARFTFGGVVEHDNRFGTDARAHVRLSIPFGGRAGDRGASPTGLDRQMGDRVRRDYVARSGSRYTDLTTSRFAVDARTGNQFGGFYYASGTGVTGAAGTLAAPTTLNDAVTRAGTNGVVVALGNSGNISTSGVTLATDQYLLGGAGAVDVRLSNGSTTQFALGGTNGVIVGTSAAGAAVTLGQGSVVRDVIVRGAGVGIAANGVGGFALDRVTIENTGGAGLSLTNTLGTVALTGLTVRGGAGAGVLINGGSNVSLANSTISGGAGAIDINDGGANLTTSLSNLTLSATGGNVLDIDGSGAGTVTVTGLSGITIRGGNGETGGLSVRSATFDASTATAGIQTVNAGRMEVGTAAARVNGQGVFLTDVTGSLSFADLDVANSGATGLRVVNSKVNSFTLATLDGTIDTVGGTAVDLDPLVINLNFAGVSSVGAAGPGVILDTVQGGGTGGNALTIGTLTISNSGGDGLVILNSTGLVRVNGGTIANSGGSSVRIGEQGVAGSGGSAGLVFAGSISDATGTSPIVAIFGTSGTINFTGPISGSGGILVQDTLAGSAISFGAITLTGTVGDAITLNGLAGSINFAGLVTISNPGANGIVIGSVPGGVTFADVDITGLGNFNGLDVRGTQGTVLFNSLDIAGTGTGTGINLTGSTNSGNVMILGPSVIQGVNVGVDLTQANMTGQFRFGDGNATPMNSTISANIPIVIALMNGSNGSYNFADANLVGDTTNLTGAGFTAYYARVGATGAGTRNDPGSLAGADASTAQYIVLLNDPAGGQDVFDAASAGGSFDLAAGQSLVSFLNGDFFAVSGASLPANLTVSGLGPSGITNVYAGSGGAVLTTSTAGAATVNLATNSTIDGLVIRNAGGDVGVEGSGVGNVRILNSNITGATGAIAISDGGAAASAMLANLDLSSSAGTTLALSGAGAGTLTVSASNIDIAATGGSAAASLTDLSSGGIAFGTVSTGNSASDALTVQGVSGGAVSIGSVAIGGTGAGTGVAITGNSAAVTVGAVSVGASAGDAVRVIGNNAAVTFGAVGVSGSSGGDAVQIVGNSAAVTFGAISAVGSGGDAVELNGNSGAVTLGALWSSGAAGAGLNIQDALGNVTVNGVSISGGAAGVAIDGVAAGSTVAISSIAVSGSGSGVTLADVDGSVLVIGTTLIANPGTSGIMIGAGSAGSITFGDVDIIGLGAGTTGVDARSASGTISFNTLDITGGSITGTRGIDLTGATFAGSFTTVDSGRITGVGVGVDLTNAAITGSFRDGDGSNTDADGAASSINAVIPIVITGINVGTGSYNFLDVALTGDTSTLTSSSTLYFVKAGATGVGTMTDPGSLAGAEASSADTIILLNDPTGGQDTLDAASAGGSFDLAAGRQLLSFLNGDTLMLPGGAPANLLLYGVPQGQIGNPYAGSGAPVLTTSTVGANTVVLGGSNTIDGVIIGTASAGGGIGVFGSGVANVTIRNSTISGSGGAIQLIDNGAAASAALSNLLLSSNGGVVLDLDGGGAGTLAITALNDITIAGGNGELGGLFVTDVLFDADLATAGAQNVVGALTIGSAGARVDGFGVDIVGDGSLDLTSLNVFNANGVGVSLIGNSDLTAMVRSGSIDTTGDAALVAQNAALALDFGSITATDGGILMIATSAADPAQRVLNVGSLNLTDGGLALVGSGDYVFANASITDNVGMAVLLGDAVNFDYAGDITSGPASNVTVGVISHTGTVSFHDGTIDATGGAGLQFIDADGTYSFTGTTTLHGGDAGIHVAFDSSGSFLFGAGTSVTNGAVANFMLEQSDANVTYLGSLAQALNTDNFVVDGQTGGVLDFSQATISASAGSGVLFVDADGTNMLGDVQLSGGATIAVITDSDGSISFGNVDITGLGANQTAVDLTGALGNVTFQTLDIAGTSTTGSKGIDLSGSTSAANIIVSESSTITGVGIGVDLTNAAITGNFRYGDGSSTDADGAASTINAVVPIEITGLNGAVGTYDFADVNLIGDTSRLVTSATTYFVAAGATGVGTMADPGSLAGAEASGAQIIVLLNNPAGGQDVLDAASAGGTFDLGTGQSLLGFLNGDTITLPAGGPTNLVLFGITPGQLVNPFAGSGAPVLTTTAATTTLVMGADTLVDGIVIDAPNGIGIIGQYANTTIRNSSVSAGSNAILIVDAVADTSVSLSNLLLSSASGAVLNLDGTNAGTLTVTALDDITILGGNGESAGLFGDSVVFDSDLATAGFQTVSGALNVGTTAARVGGVGLYLTQAQGDLDLDLDLATLDTGADITGTGGFRFATSGGSIDVSNGVAYGLLLTDLSADVVLSSLVYSGTGNAVGTQNVAGFGPAGRALDIGALSVADGAANAITMTGSAAGSFSFGASSSIGTTTGAAILVSNSGASTLNYSGAINYAGADAVLSVTGGHTGTVNLAGSISATSGTGLVFDNADGAYNFTGIVSLASGISIANGSAGSFAFADTAITSPTGAAIDIQDSSASLSFAGTISYSGGAAAAVNIVNHSGGTVSFAGFLDITTGSGINFDNADGTYNFNGVTNIDAGSAGIVIANGSDGSFTFGAGTTILNMGGSALSVSASTASIDYLGYAYAFGGNGISIVDHAIGTIDFTGATLDLNGASTLYFDDADGSYVFGSFATTSGATIAIVNGSAGSFSFGDVDIADIGAGQTAVNLTGATGNVTFQTLDITGIDTTGSKGIDLTGSTTAANIVINESSAITGVGIGVDLTNAAITGTFRYGDGSSTDADGAASSINAVTPLVIAGLNPGVGSYDFADVVLTGDTSGLNTTRTIFWVQAGAAGAGTRADPGSLAAAEASGADVIILLDTQVGAGQDVIDGATAGGGLDLATNQSLLSFLSGDSLNVGGGAPANILLFGISGGTVTNPYAGSGAPLLTTTQAGATTVNLASGVLIEGVQIGNLNWKGIFGDGVTGVTIRNSIVHGGLNAINIIDNAGSADVAFDSLALSSDSGDVLSLIGSGAGQLTVTRLTGIAIAGGNAGSGFYSEDVTFDSDLATGGIQMVVGTLDIGSAANRTGGSGLVLDGATGALVLATSVFNTDGDGIFAHGGAGGFALAITGTVDTGLVTTSGSALNLFGLGADIQLTSVAYAGVDSGVIATDVTGLGAGGRTIDIGTLTVASGAASGISLGGSTNGNFNFGSGSSITGTTVSGIVLANSGTGSFSYGGGITATAGALVTASSGDIGSATFSGTLSATGGTGLQFDNADGSYNFTGTTTLNGGDAGIDIVNGSGGSFTFGTGTSITSPSGTGINIADSTASVTYSGNLTYATAGNRAIDIANHSGGTITFQTGTINATGGMGVRFGNADGTYDFTGTTTLSGVAAGLAIGNDSGGTFDFGSGTSVDATVMGFSLANSAANVTFAGTLTSSAGYTLAVSDDLSTLDMTSATLGATGGSGISFDNADGSYTLGSFTLSGGAWIAVTNGSGGTLTFGDVDITGTGAGETAVDLIGADGDVTFNTLDITGASTTGSRGISLASNSGTGDIVVTNSSTISGVGIGVDLTNASRTGLFQYGDGESAVDVASTITATTPIVITGLNGATGTYNFADVNLAGDTSGLATSATVYYVLAGATGSGTLGDPGSLAGAEASAADIIILLNDPTGGQDVLDALGSNGNDTLVLDANQALRSFRDGNVITLPGGAPANVILTGVITGQVTNPYAASAPTAADRAPILTTTGAANTVTLASGNLIDGVFIQSASGFAGIYGSGASGITLSNATLSGAGTALRLLDGGLAATATLTNLSLAASGGSAALELDGTGAGTLTVTGSGLNVAHSGAGALLSFDDIAIGAGGLAFGTVASTATGAGVSIETIAGPGTLSFISIGVAGASGAGVTLNGATGTVNLGDVTVSGATGPGLSLVANGGNITVGTVNVSASGTGISIVGNGGTLNIGDSTLDGATIAGIAFGAGNTATINFGNVDITGLQANARGVDARNIGAGDITFATLDISGASATGTRGIDLTGNTGTGNFIVAGSSTITGVGVGVDLTNASRTGLFQYGDGESVVDIASFITLAPIDQPIVVAGLNGATGSYNFADVNLTGDTSPLETSAYFVDATGTGNGSAANPGSLANAMASGAAYIVLLDSQAGAGSFDTITGTLTLADGQTLLSFRDTDTFNVTGGAPANVIVTGIIAGQINNPNAGSGAPLLTSTNGTGTVQLGGTNVIDGVVVSNTGTGAGIYGSGNAGTVTIRNSTVSGGGAAISLASGAATLGVNLQNLTLANAGNQTGALLDLDGGGGTLTVTGMSNLSIVTSGGESDGLVFDTVTFDSDLATAGIQAVNAGAITIGTSGARVQGEGLNLTNVSGALTFTDLDIANIGGTGLVVANSKANSFLLTTLDGSYDTTGGAAVNLDPLTVNITVASVTASGGAYGILLDQVDGSFTVTGAVTVTGATTAGIAIQDNTALTATFNGAVAINNTSGAGLSFTNNTGATIAFAGGGSGIDVVTTSGAALTASGGGTFSFGGSGNSLTSTTGTALTLDGVTLAAGGVNFAGVAANGASNGVVLTSVTSAGGGTISLGTVNLQGITTRGIDVNTALGATLSITDLDIGLNSTTATAFDLNGAALSAAITVGDFDVTNAAAAGTSIAVDLRGTTGAQTILLGDSAPGGATSSIAGVGTGVYLNAATNAAFTFGDGESATDGTATISATTGIDASAAPASGSYNFRDVTFAASPGLGFGVGRTLFVDSNGATGGGNGSGADGANPMTLAAAELILAATDVIVLVNNGTAISAAGSNGDDTLNLLASTQVRGFGQGPLALTLTVPSTIQLSSSTINIADPTGNGAATLTSATGANVITLGASGNHISGFILDGDPAGALRGIVDNGGASGTVIDFMTIRNFDAVGGYGIEITPSTSTTIDNVTFTGNTNDVLLNAAGSTITNVTATGATGTSITLDNATGTTTLTNVNITGAASGMSFTNAGGTINATNVDIAGAATSALTISGGTAGFNFDSASSIVQAAGGLTLNVTGNHTAGTFAFAGTINATSGNGMQFSNADGTYNFTGTTTFNGGNAGIDIYNGATGTFAFGSGTTLTHNNAGNAFVLLSSANVTFDGAITDNNGVAVEIDAHDAGTATFNGAISSGIGNASTVISIVNSNGGAIDFKGAMNIASTATVVSLSSNAGSTITFDAGGTGLDIESTTGTGMLITGGGTVNVLGSDNTITTTSGTLLSVTNTGATATAVDLSFASANNTVGANGIFVQRTAGTLGGTVDIGSGAIAASTRGISLAGDALDFTFGGTITATGGRSFEATGRTAGTVTLSGAIEDAFNGINIATNSGGTINVSGNLNAAGVGVTGALTVTGNTGGTINFSGATKRFNTGAATAVNLASNGGTTINFASGGLAITTSSGTGFSATGGGTIAVTGANNTIQTATGQIANLNAVSGGTGGINFATLASSGMVSGTAISFNNFDGTSFTVTGTTNITGGTGGGTDDGIFIGNNSAATVTFGATTIAGSIGDDGIEVNGAGNGAVTFSSVTIDNTLGHGVEINGSTGTVSINGGSIGATNDPASNGVLVTGGSGTVTIASSIAKTTAGSVVSVTGRTGGTVTFSGNITASGAADNGISVASNTGGTINFTGQTISLTTGANTGVNLATNSGATINFAPAGGGNGLDIVTTSGAGFSATGGGTVTVQGGGNTIQTATGQVINLTGVSAGAGGVNFATLTSTGVVTGIALNFSNFDSSGGGAFSGGTTSVAGSTSDGIFIGAGSAANVSFGATTIGTGANTVTGDGIEINGAGNGAVTFTSVDIDNVTAHGVNITGAAGATGAITISGGTIGGGGAGSVDGDGVNITSGGGDVTIAASITKTNAGNVVEVSSHTGGTILLSGNLSASGAAANGILLSNNSGGTITFSGATKTINTGANHAIQMSNTAGTGAAVSFTGGNLDVDTTTGNGITTSSTTAGAGSLVITGTNNTITSAGGIALNVVNTNIAAGGLNFLSISANGGSRGIVLNNTGAAAGLTVTGSSTTDGSGGTIQNITARGIELLNTAQVNISNLNLTNASTTGQAAGQDLDLTTANGAIYMSSVATAVFENINITGTIADNGITGINVSNFQLNNSLINGAGDGANESGIEFSNLSGTSSLTNTEIAFSETNSLDIVNTDVNLNLTLNNVIFRDTQTVSSGGASNGNGEGGLQFRSFSSAAGTPTTNIDVINSDFLRLRTQGIQVVGEDDSVVSVDIVNNIIQSQADIGAGIDINGNDTANVTFNINTNTIQSQGGHTVNITSFLDSNVMGRISGNTITANGTGAGGSGVRAVAQETSQIIIDVNNNSITAGAGNTSNMIDMQARFDTARLDATINNNNIDSDAAALADINITAGSSTAGESNQVYVNILNNDIAAGGPTNVLRLRVSDLASATRLFLTGFTEGGAGVEDDAVATWNNNTNTPLATTSNIAVSLTGTAVGPVAGTALTPTNPAP